ncbi:Uncharacterized protein APZ42_019748 [Daphnia magna]|uniref:Uncharacterized protein n=1 Tax=Daphnia magna TaxID=35525 RepID=A0A0P5WT45_9CRUS|nr:Uncharacterized protein APZ42_019748 [Daphnia magna]
MQSEIQKTLNLSRTVNSPVVKPSVQPNLDVSRPIKPATKHRKNERQQLIGHLEEIVDVQEMLFSLSKRSPESEIREDFDYGLRGAIRLSHYDFEILTTFHFLITSPERPKTVVDFILNVPHEANHKAAQHFKWLLEGRKMLAEGTNISYYDGKSIISRILRSGYFSRIRLSNSKKRTEITHNGIQTDNKQSIQSNKSASPVSFVAVDKFLVNISSPLKETNRII